MDSTDIPDGAHAGDEALPPNLDDLESPDSLLNGGPIRGWFRDVVTGLRTPTKASDIADRDTTSTANAPTTRR